MELAQRTGAGGEGSDLLGGYAIDENDFSLHIAA
jgi:hypothetical protein